MLTHTLSSARPAHTAGLPHRRRTGLIAVLGLALLTSPALGQIVYYEDFAEGLGGFVIDNDFGNGNGLWHRSVDCEATNGDHTGPHALYYGVDGACDYNAGMNEGVAVSPVIDLNNVFGTIELSFNYWLESEGDPMSFDMASVELSANGGAYVPIAHADASLGVTELVDPSLSWRLATVDLTAYAGQTVQVRFRFNTVDDQFNEFPGFYVDDIMIAGRVGDPLELVAAASRMEHGPAGLFDLDLPLALTQTVSEPRLGAPATIVLTFSSTIAAADGSIDPNDEVTVTPGTVESATAIGTELIVELSGITSPDCVRLTLEHGPNGLVDSTGLPLIGDPNVNVRVMTGDVDNSGLVVVFDLLSVRNRLSYPLAPDTFGLDCQPDGTIDIFDLLTVRNNLSRTATCP